MMALICKAALGQQLCIRSCSVVLRRLESSLKMRCRRLHISLQAFLAEGVRGGLGAAGTEGGTAVHDRWWNDSVGMHIKK